jgi:hypothetical protein
MHKHVVSKHLLSTQMRCEFLSVEKKAIVGREKDQRSIALPGHH